MTKLPTPAPDIGRNRWLQATLIYLLCIAYGSLLPFDFTFHTWPEAWQRFAHMPYLAISVQSRADWLANLLLYLPLGFFASGMARAGRARWPVSLCLMFAFLLCTCAAVGIEFAQVYFPPRTVSWNDLIAETLGSLGGIVLYLLFARKLDELKNSLLGNRENAKYLALTFYAAGYLILSLFPFDFLLSLDELRWKLSTDMVAPFLAGHGCAHFFSCAAKLGAEILASAPLGFLLARAKPRVNPLGAAGWGAALGIGIETLQFFLASGISQGASVFTRAIGMGTGYTLAAKTDQPHFKITHLRWLTALFILPYLALLATLNGWATHDWLGLEDVSQRLETLRFLPFYYHYYTSETVAMASLLTQAAMYAPIGFACWIAWPEKSARSAAFLAAPIALVMESGKLFIAGKHSDPTDILIASASAAAIYWLCAWWSGANNLATSHTSSRPERKNTPIIHRLPVARSAKTVANETDGFFRQARRSPAAVWGIQQGAATTHDGKRRCFMSSFWRNGLLASATAACVAYITWHYPLGAFWPAILLAGYAVVLWRIPSAWLVAVLALLPVMDLAPWTGWFFLDEFDLLLLTTFGILLLRNRLAYPVKYLPASATLLAGLFALSYLISLLTGLLPLQPAAGLNAFSSYYSHYNALRVAKGFVWALLFLPVLTNHVREGTDLPRQFTFGMVLGLAAVVLVVLWERYVFSGLFNFSDDYRITASFSTMHTGGGHVEGYLAVALPFAVIWVYQSKNFLVRVAGIGLFALGVYAMLVTFSRGGYLALAIGGTILLSGIFFHARQGAKGHVRSAVWVPLLLLIAASAISIPILQGTYIQSRFAQVGKDLHTRTSHWLDAFRMIEPGWQASLFGMGLGRYPEIYYWKNAEGVNPARYSYETEGDNVYLRLGSGNSLYVEQLVAVRPGRNYVLSMDLRSKSPNARITVPVCEKSLLYSFECEWRNFRLKSSSGQWEHYELHFNSKQIAKGNWLSRRPVKLSLFNSSSGTLIDVDNVALMDEDGKNLVSNGDFSNANEHWFFSTDNHLPWHIKNLAVQVIFDQGWLGLTVFSAWLIYAFLALVKGSLRGTLFSTALLASLSGFLAVGLFDSLFDAPRLTMLFFILLFLSGLRQTRRRPAKNAAAPANS